MTERKGLIYIIEGAGLNYIGSTIQPLYERKSYHKSSFKRWINSNKTTPKCCSFDILEKCNDWTIRILEEVITDKKKEAVLKKEQEWIFIMTDCVNKNNAISSVQDRKEYKTEWARKDRIKKGIEPKRVIADEDREEYKKEVYEKQKERIEKMTEEEYKLYRDKRNEDNKKCYATNNGKEYQREYKKNKLQNMTQEERDIHNQKQRENYAKRKSRLSLPELK